MAKTQLIGRLRPDTTAKHGRVAPRTLTDLLDDDLTLDVYVLGLGLMVTAINQIISTARSDEQREYEVNRDKGLKQLLTEIRDRM